MKKQWTMRRYRALIAILAATFWIPVTLADSQPCSQEDAAAAEAVAATAKTWKMLGLYFKRYANCDDGAIAEGFSESATVLLAQHWGAVKQLIPLVARDPAFREFIVRHIDASVPVERLRKIAGNAARKCPQNMRALCHDIGVAAVRSEAAGN